MGAYIRTSTIVGAVTVDQEGLAGVTVTLSGVTTATTVTETDAAGRFAFTGLRMGSYLVEISGFDAEKFRFPNTAESVSAGKIL